jgi:hypothetical protein
VHLLCSAVQMKILLVLQLRELSRWPDIQLALTLYEMPLPRVVQMFYLLDPTCKGPHRLFRRSDGVRSVTTMCCLSFVPNK